MLAPDLTVTTCRRRRSRERTARSRLRIRRATRPARPGTGVDDELLPLHRRRLGLRRHAVRQPRGPGSGGRDARVSVTTQSDAASVADGNYFIIAKADSPLAITETNETNNILSKAITIGADLSVSVLAAPAKSGAGLSVHGDGHDRQCRRQKRCDGFHDGLLPLVGYASLAAIRSSGRDPRVRSPLAATARDRRL